MEWALPLFAWPFGIFVGLIAAEKRGFSKATGALAGLFLGPLFAWILFMEMGYGSVECPKCRTKADANARFCKKCSATLPDPYADR